MFSKGFIHSNGAVLAAGMLLLSGGSVAALNRDTAVISEELVGGPTTAYNHASTICQAPDGTLLVAWFGGSLEGADDVSIYLSRNSGAGWSPIVEVNKGIREDSKDYACWNPVLFTASSGTIYLYYKISSIQYSVDPAGYHNWWGCYQTSVDNGVTWSARQWLPTSTYTYLANFGTHLTGPVKNKPLELPNGKLLCGSSTETDAWRVHLETGAAGNWTGSISVTGPITSSLGIIQPTFLHTPGYDTIQMICRNESGNYPYRAWSYNTGQTWTSATALTGITAIVGLDGVTLSNGKHVLAHNPAGARYPLRLASCLDGTTWSDVLTSLDVNGTNNMDYPSIIQSRDGRIHIVHSWGRSAIKHLVLDASYVTGGPPTRTLPSVAQPAKRIIAGTDIQMFDIFGRKISRKDLPGRPAGICLVRSKSAQFCEVKMLVK